MSKKKTVKEYLINGDNYFPNVQAERASTLPAGAYECRFTMDGAPFFTPIEIVTDKIIDIPNSFTLDVVDEIKKFWSSAVSEKFNQYGLVHKRGVLLAGRPGTGKSVTLAKAAQVVINDFEGVVLFNPNVDGLVDFLRLIKDIEPQKKVLIMWEEFDYIIDSNETVLLSLLDGEIQVGNIFYLATTNYLAKIPSRIKNRPSRFAKIIEVTAPDIIARRAFLKAKLHESDVNLLESMVQASEGFVIDQLKDLIISVCCFGYPISESILKIKEMEEDGMGIDDYNEEQANSIFKKISTDGKKHRGRNGPLIPLK